MLLFILHFTNAQTTAEASGSSDGKATHHSSSKSATRININIDRNQKLKIRMEDNDFELGLKFKKSNTKTVGSLITKYLGDPKSQSRGTKKWSDAEGSYKIQLKNNNLVMTVDKAVLSDGQWESFIGFATDLLTELGFEIELDL